MIIYQGHLAGILVGLMYLYGPLKQIIDSLVPSKCAFLIIFIKKKKFFLLIIHRFLIQPKGKIEEITTEARTKIITGMINKKYCFIF